MPIEAKVTQSPNRHEALARHISLKGRNQNQNMAGHPEYTVLPSSQIFTVLLSHQRMRSPIREVLEKISVQEGPEVEWT